MIYLASPYSDPDPAVRMHRFNAACQATAAFLQTGQAVFSPVVQGHHLVEHGLPGGWQFWQHFDRAFLQRCDEVVVLQLDGWQDSEGVQAEVCLALELGMTVRYLAPGEVPGSPTMAHVRTADAS